MQLVYVVALNNMAASPRRQKQNEWVPVSQCECNSCAQDPRQMAAVEMTRRFTLQRRRWNEKTHAADDLGKVHHSAHYPAPLFGLAAPHRLH